MIAHPLCEVRGSAILVLLRFIAAGTAMAFLGACASSADPNAMVVLPQAEKTFPQGLLQAMCVRTVGGGEETNPLWTSKVDDVGFRVALSSSLDKAGLTASSECRYPIDVNLLGLSQPIVGLDMTVTSHVNYKVYNSSNSPILLETINAPYTAAVSDSFLAVERLKKANEGSIRQSIQMFFDRLRNLDAGSLILAPATGAIPSASLKVPGAPQVGPATRAGTPPELDRANGLPHSNETMAANYREFLNRPLPRAFAVSENGESRMAWGMAETSTEDPAKRAVALCQKETGSQCFLYAVDNKVVYGGKETPIAGNARKQTSDRAPRPQLPKPIAIDDLSQLPYSSDAMVKDYRLFLTGFIPRAFAISESGEWGGVSGRVYIGTLSPTEHLSAIPAISSFEAGKRAVDICERRARGRCFLYAVDNRVVYVEDQEKPLP